MIRTEYRYQVGEVVNTNFRVIEKNKINSGKYKRKGYIIECLQCKSSKVIREDVLVDKGLNCGKCSKHTSYPELFMISYLNVKGIKYEYQKVFKDLPNRRFDFYLPESNTVIETHGEQHYEEERNNTKWDYSKTHASDIEKKKYCDKMGVLYIEVDCRKSEFKHIKSEVNSSLVLPHITKKEEYLVLEEIKRNKVYPINEFIYLYENGYSITDIGCKYNLNQSTIWRIFKRHNILMSNKKKKVKCINTGKIFNSCTEACESLEISNTSINNHLKGRTKSAGKHPDTGERLTWEYVD